VQAAAIGGETDGTSTLLPNLSHSAPTRTAYGGQKKTEGLRKQIMEILKASRPAFVTHSIGLNT
jgi:hypothetical protein